MIKDIDFNLISKGFKMLNYVAIIFWLGIAIALGATYGLVWFGIALTFPFLLDVLLSIIESILKRF